MCRRFFTCRNVDRAQRVWDSGDWLHSGPHAQDLSGAHATFNATRSIAQPLEAIALNDFIVCGTSGSAGRLEAVTDLYPLDCLNTHKSPCQARVKSAIPVHK
ncbi:unannotated protein [freshwater metagenome]|uniref:Unannotated protein n=1 Tax=freshwater metagenome TaxID=449393 RepID=A0A6J6BRQ4_9ZZZZ